MGIFNKTKQTGGLMDEIRCDEQSYLIWKWHPAGVKTGESRRENSIRWGSSLRVKDGEVAVFVYKQDDGTKQDFIVGPCDDTLKTANLPVLASIIGLAYDGGTPFQAEVYFINLARVIQSKFAVPFFDIYDPRFDDFGVPVAVRGTISFSIANYREFIKLHRLNSFDLNDFQKQIKDAVIRYVKDVVANAPAANSIPVIQIETKIGQIADVIEYDVKDRLREDFGVEVSAVDINAIEIDKSSDGYSQLMHVTRDVTNATVQAETAAKAKDIADKQRIDVENYEEILRIQREEAQYAQHKSTQSSNMAAFQIEKQAEVGIAGANALGQMGSNGAGSVDISGGGDGFNMAAMMASMAVGGAVGQNIAGSMNNIMSGISQPIASGTVPPPVPRNVYHVAVDGQATGPFDMDVLAQKVTGGQITSETLVWKNGLEQWVKAGEIEELKSLFTNAVPPVPLQDL